MVGTEKQLQIFWETGEKLYWNLCCLNVWMENK